MPAAAAQVVSLREEKDTLRRKMREERSRVGADVREKAGRAAADRILKSLTSKGTAALFWSAHDEIGTELLASALWERGVQLAFPRVEAGDILFLETPSKDALRPGSFGLLEPAAGLSPVAFQEIDFVLVPGLAFDERGGRLGYGKGYYDRALRRLRPQARTVGFCFDFQLLHQVPQGPSDVPVGEVVTDLRHVRCGGIS